MADRAGADFAVLGGAAIAGKSVKPPGDITVGDIFSWFPNDTLIMTVQIKGSTVKKMLDVMVREVPLEAPSFPHPSRALSFTINTMRTPTTVQDICVNGAPIDPDKDYVVAVEDFVGLGKAKYKFVPAEGITLRDDEAAEQITYWIIDYFEKHAERSAETEQKLSLLTNVAMRDKIFGITSVKNRLLAAAAAGEADGSSPAPIGADGSASSSMCSSSIGGAAAEAALSAAVAGGLGDGAAALILTEASRLAAHQRARMETVYFELETALRRVVPCQQARVFHIIPNTNTAWYRTNDAGARRVTVPLGGTAVGHLMANYASGSKQQGTSGGFVGTYDASCEGITISIGRGGKGADVAEASPFSPAIEGIAGGPYGATSYMCVPLLFGKQPLCVAVLVNRQSQKGESAPSASASASSSPSSPSSTPFTSRDLEMATLLLAQAQPVVSYAVAAAEREEEEERRRDLVMLASDLVQSSDTTIVNDKIVSVNKSAKGLFGVEKATFYVYDRAAEDFWTVRRSVNSQKQSEDVIIRKSAESAGILASAIRLRTIARYTELPAPSLAPSVSATQFRQHLASSSTARSGSAARGSVSAGQQQQQQPAKSPLLLRPPAAGTVGHSGSSAFSPERSSRNSNNNLSGSMAISARVDRLFSRNALVIPVESKKEKGELCGVLLLADKEGGGSFTAADERLVANLVPFIAIAVDTSTEMEVLRTGLDRSKLKAFPVHELNRIRFKRGWGSVRSRLSYIASDHFKEKHMQSEMEPTFAEGDDGVDVDTWEPLATDDGLSD